MSTDKWTADETAVHFQGRAPEYIARAEKAAAHPFAMATLPMPLGGAQNLLEAAWWLIEKKGRPQRVLDFGCGCGQFFKFFTTGLGITSYRGLDASEPAIAAANKIWGEYFRVMDLRMYPARAPLKKADLAFCHGVLMHLPAAAAQTTATLMRLTAPLQMVIEMTRPRPEDNLAPHIFIHDYTKLFGTMILKSPLNEYKDIFIFENPKRQVTGD